MLLNPEVTKDTSLVFRLFHLSSPIKAFFSKTLQWPKLSIGNQSGLFSSPFPEINNWSRFYH